jgi:hypothetical protein
MYNKFIKVSDLKFAESTSGKSTTVYLAAQDAVNEFGFATKSSFDQPKDKYLGWYPKITAEQQTFIESQTQLKFRTVDGSSDAGQIFVSHVK